jgi:hypothetical protein
LPNRGQDAFEIAQDIKVGDAEYSGTASLNTPIAVFVAWRIDMRHTIDLHDQTRASAVEVNDERTKRHLSPKLETVELVLSQRLPEFAFCGR